ncbi:MAG: hypothetical protein HY020_07105 [Burkholderiales bacterium]|nr:hypothetical protein [Burkholderiales bacterium]
MEAVAEEDAPLGVRQAVERFFEILFLAMERAQSTPATLPEDFNVSDATLAALANSALALSPDDRIRATDVRDFRPNSWRLDGLVFEDTGA